MEFTLEGSRLKAIWTDLRTYRLSGHLIMPDWP